MVAQPKQWDSGDGKDAARHLAGHPVDGYWGGSTIRNDMPEKVTSVRNGLSNKRLAA